MTWVNPSAVLTQYRAQLLLCPTITAVTGIVIGSFHYPTFGPSGASPDAFPAILLQETEERERYAEGAIPLISGTLKASFFFLEADATDAGWLETFCRNVVLDLGKQYSGIAFRRHGVTLASDPTPGARAAGGNNLYRAATITSVYGLSR